MRALGTIIVVALVVLLGAHDASATTVTEYAVTIEGKVSYDRSDLEPQGVQRREKATFDFKTRLPSVTFIGKQFTAVPLGETTISGARAEGSIRIPVTGGDLVGTCTASTGKPLGFGALAEAIIPTPDPQLEGLGVRALGGVMFQLASCSGNAPSAQSFGLGGGDETIGTGPFDDHFDLPHEAIGMGKIIQLVETNLTGDQCPEHNPHTTSCVFGWKGTVTFVRTAQRELGDAPDPRDVVLPQPKPGPDPDLYEIPMPRPRPRDPDLDLIPMPKATRLSANAARARVALTCRAACSGDAIAYAASRRARAAADRPLARTRFTGAAGKPTTITLRFGAKARRAIRRAGGIRVELRVTPRAGGTPVRRTVRVALRRR